jgi:putative transposase
MKGDETIKGDGHVYCGGHTWQGRYKAFPIEHDDHLLTVLRYVERNPVRANLVRQAAQWSWSSASLWQAGVARPSYLAVGPVKRPRNWLQWVDQPLTDAELEALRRSVNRGAPFGSSEWNEKAAVQWGLEATLRPRGRPRKEQARE